MGKKNKNAKAIQKDEFFNPLDPVEAVDPLLDDPVPEVEAQEVVHQEELPVAPAVEGVPGELVLGEDYIRDEIEAAPDLEEEVVEWLNDIPQNLIEESMRPKAAVPGINGKIYKGKNPITGEKIFV
jgi:hypothetical protein